MKYRKALFLDRDGVINHDDGYTYRIEDFRFMEGLFDYVKLFTDKGYLVFVITNQAGISRGIFTEDDFRLLTDWMIRQFAEKGITVERVYYCPHHPDINGPCACRKPEPGMILEAVKEYNLDTGSCFLTGDKETDLEAGRRAGIPESNLGLFSGQFRYLPCP